MVNYFVSLSRNTGFCMEFQMVLSQPNCWLDYTNLCIKRKQTQLVQNFSSGKATVWLMFDIGIVAKLFCKMVHLREHFTKMLCKIYLHYKGKVNKKIKTLPIQFWINKANLRDLIAATSLVILLKFDPNHPFSACVTLKFDGWPWKTIWHLFYSASSLVHHFKAMGEIKLELQSGNAQLWSKSAIFCLVWPWNLRNDLEK